jgi:hypothetical protein
MPRRLRSVTRSVAAICLTLVMAAALAGTRGVLAAGLTKPGAGQTPQGQPPPPLPPPPAGDRPLRLFVDCTNAYCDTEYFRTEITFVDHVRDRRDADVHALVTGENTGGGGREYTFAFIGQGRFDKVNHTLRFVSKITDTSDETRRGMVTTLKLGLVRYVADTPAGRELQIGFRRPAAGADAARPAHDPWNFWVFSANLQGTTRGEASVTAVSLYGGFSANRVTEDWKVLTSVSGNYSQSDYTFSEGDTYTSVSRGYSGSALVVNSLGRHWGAGGQAGVWSSTYSNIEVKERIAPAIEYNVFPYSESTRRQLTFNYSVGASRANYLETTIYGKDRETLFDQALQVTLDMRQPWGTTSTSFEASHYLNDFSKNRLVLYGDLDVRLFKGFSLTAWGSVSRIRDQINLPAGEATQEEVLVRQRQLATNYDYYVSMGVSYRFGSIFNNVVNARFNNARQTMR